MTNITIVSPLILQQFPSHSYLISLRMMDVTITVNSTTTLVICNYKHQGCAHV